MAVSWGDRKCHQQTVHTPGTLIIAASGGGAGNTVSRLFFIPWNLIMTASCGWSRGSSFGSKILFILQICRLSSGLNFFEIQPALNGIYFSRFIPWDESTWWHESTAAHYFQLDPPSKRSAQSGYSWMQRFGRVGIRGCFVYDKQFLNGHHHQPSTIRRSVRVAQLVEQTGWYPGVRD